MSRRYRTRSTRAAASGVGAALLLLAGAPAAAAAPGLVVPLDPPGIDVVFLPTENLGDPTHAGDPGWEPFVPVPIRWGGSVDLQVPSGFDASDASFELALGDEDDEEPTRTYSTETPAPDDLVVTDVGGGHFEVTMPADDGVDGPFGLLSVDGLVPLSGDDIDAMPLSYFLEFDAAASPVQSLVPHLLAMAAPSCPMTPAGDCIPYSVTAGEQIELTVPPGSRLRNLGLGTLADAEALLVSEDTGYVADATTVDENAALLSLAAARADSPSLASGLLAGAEELSAPAGASGGVLASASAAAVPAPELEPGVLQVAVEPIEPYRARLTVPAAAAAGLHTLMISERNAATGSYSMSMLLLEIPAAPVENAGLHSATDWNEPVVPGSSPEGSPGLVLLGGGMLLAAGGAALWVLRPRRDEAASACAD
jgi:hypothetical protein